MPLTRPHVRAAAFGAAALVLVACNRPDESELAARHLVTEAVATPTADTSAATVEDGANANPPDRLIATSPTGAGVATPAHSGAVQTALTASETAFLRAAAGTGQYEMQAARMALDKTTDPAVKSLASLLVTHHALSNDRLQRLAASRNLSLPSDLPPEKQQSLAQLNQATGPAFDRQFVQTVGVKGHEAGIALFAQAEQDARDAEVRRFVQDTLPSLKSHLATARTLRPSEEDRNLPRSPSPSPRTPS